MTEQELARWRELPIETWPMEVLRAEVERLRASEDVAHASSRLLQQIDKTAAAEVRAFRLEEILREMTDYTELSHPAYPSLWQRARALLAEKDS